MTRARHIGLASMSVSDEIMQAALDFTQPFTRYALERRAGRDVSAWLLSQVAHGNLRRWRVDHMWFFEWVN